MVQIEVSELLASIIQRLLVDEINNQEQWMIEDLKNERPDETRLRIINEAKDLQNQLENKGIKKFRYYN